MEAIRNAIEAKVRKAVEVELKDKTDRKVRNVFFLCHSAGDYRSIYCVQGNNGNIFAVAFVDENDQVEVIF